MRTRIKPWVKSTGRFIWKWTKYIYQTIKGWIFRRYRITVSFNNEYGDGDDRNYIAKKILIQKEKHLKFVDEDGKKIEHRSPGGLNFIIEDYEYEPEDS